MKAVFFSDNPENITNAYGKEAVELIKKYYDIDHCVICRANINKHFEAAKNAEAIFSAWGMERFSEEEIKQYFPNIKYIFYAAGSVQHFAKEFFNCSVRIFSANEANAIPVAEYAFSQIVLANKGMFLSMRDFKKSRQLSFKAANESSGNYGARVGLIGIGQIGKRVATLLKNLDCTVLYYDPFLPEEDAEKLGITEASLEAIFEQCDCISNHLADKDELTGMLNYSLFSRMKPRATFINTARGRQVDEDGLVKALKECKTRTAILDVTYPEPPKHNSPLLKAENIFLTPHIAGSLSSEIFRMGDYMAREAQRIASEEQPLFEVTAKMLKTMA